MTVGRIYLRYSFFLQIVFLFLIYFFLYKTFMPRVLEFGCFDDCHTIAAGYFLTKGKILYSEIFYNHQPVFPYFSALIQNISNPQNIYELILRHRQFILFFSLLFNLILFFRFGTIAVIFTIFFETTKFYFFGDRFLPETLIIYPIIYMSLLLVKKLRGEKVLNIDLVLSAVFSFFVIFSREPYIPITLTLLLLIFLDKSYLKIKSSLIFLLCMLGLLFVISFNLSEYLFILFKFNSQGVIENELSLNGISGLGILKLAFYPFYLFSQGEESFLRYFLMGIVSLLLASLAFYYKKNKDLKLPLLIFLLLFLANPRFVIPGQLYFETYRILVWYGLLLAFSLFTLFILYKDSLKVSRILFLIFFGIWSLFLLNKNSYIWDKPDPQKSLLTNYGRYLSTGEVIKKLKMPNDTLFIDGADEIIYWTGKTNSSYRYSMYTSLMPRFEKYRNERRLMFSKNPPDFYYDYCLTSNRPRYSLGEFSELYINLKLYNNPSCLFVRKNKLPEISDSQWEKIKEWGFEKPSSI